MRVFVRSRSQAVSGGRGYFWKPAEPEVVREIEGNQELLREYSRTLLIWTRYGSFGGVYYHMYLSGLDAGYKDELDRPIKHTVVWETNGGERRIRELALAYVDNPDAFEERVRSVVEHHDDCGFSFREHELLKLADGRLPKRRGAKAPPNLTEPETRAEVMGYLATYALCNIWCRWSVRSAGGLLVAFGERFSGARLQIDGHHRLLQLVCDSTKFPSEAQ